ncbi:aldolase, partial [Candidatus Entotheonella serta]
GPADGAAGTTAPYDGTLFEMEHAPYDIQALQTGLQGMLDRRQIAQQGIAPAVTPIVRIPPNQGQSNWVAKQVLDIGLYGIIWPHVDTVEDAYNAVAAMRYPRVEGRPLREPFGRRGDAPRRAVTYWGLTQQEYYDRADVWPLNPQGELLCGLMIESPEGIGNLPKMLKEVPGIGVVFTGEGDLSQELGHPRQYDHPDVLKGVKEVLDI